MVPVRFSPELLEEIRRRADADDRSLFSWIRRAAERELTTPADRVARAMAVTPTPFTWAIPSS